MSFITTHHAWITGPVYYALADGDPMDIPLGPCRVERSNESFAVVTWGPPHGQKSASLQLHTLQEVKNLGHLVLLD